MVLFTKRMCTRCIYDDSTPGISFNEDGVCNYCELHDQMCEQYPTGDEGASKLFELSWEIQDAGKGKKYDCIVGVSGGSDSSYMLGQAIALGLRPLAVHFDNGWNSEIAEENMRKVTKMLNVDFIRIGMDKLEFDDICRAFLLSGVSDVDVPNDIALATVLYEVADIFGVKYILNGHSFRTEGTAPTGFTYMDAKYVADVHKKYGQIPMKTFPNMWLWKWLKWIFIKRIKRVRPLYYVDYNKEDVKKYLSKKYCWKWYGGPHCENKYTYFAGNYIHPKKFGIDLRQVIYGGMVRSGQMSREKALKELSKPPKTPKTIVTEVLGRFRISKKQLSQNMKQQRTMYYAFKTYEKTFKRLRPLFWLAYKFNLVPATFYKKYCCKRVK